MTIAPPRPPRTPRSPSATAERRRRRRQQELRRRRALAGIALTALLAFGLGAVAASASPDLRLDSAVPGKLVWKPLAQVEAERDLAAIEGIRRENWFVSQGGPNKRQVALTFDDGPNRLTPQFVRVLRRERVPATFFVVGQQIRENPMGLRAAIDAGMVIGAHTVSHPMMAGLGAADQAREVRESALQIQAAGSPYPRLYRPPGRSFNDTTRQVLGRERSLMVLWSVDSRDYTQPGAQAITQRVVESARPGSIILLHDGGGDRSQTLAALPGIIRMLRERGYKFVTVPRLLRDDPPPREQPLPEEGGAT